MNRGRWRAVLVACSLWGMGCGSLGSEAERDSGRPGHDSEGEAESDDGDNAGSDATPGPECGADEECSVGWACRDGGCVPPAGFTAGPSADELIAMGMVTVVPPPSEPPEIGAVIDSFCGVTAHQNGPVPSQAANLSGPFGIHYQSTELAYRFLCQHYELCDSLAEPYGSARTWFTDTAHPVLGGLQRFKSRKTAVPPRAGDLLVFDVGEWGHVAVVKDVLSWGSRWAVSVIEQNVHDGTHLYELQVSGGIHTIQGAIGWMRVPDAQAACGCAPDAEVRCVDGQLVGFDACGRPGAVVTGCDDGDPCTADGCVDEACTHTPVADGAPCGGGRECHGGACMCPEGSTSCEDLPPARCPEGECTDPCVDADGDGFYANCPPFDCPGHDNDRFIHPGSEEVWDIRDNDCDGTHDDVGHVVYRRYFKAWTEGDWEHRFSAAPIPGWDTEPFWIALYPIDVCTGAFAPSDGCTIRDGGATIELWGGLVLEAVSQCTGATVGSRFTLLLGEEGGEFRDYDALPGFTCTRLGYSPAEAGHVMPNTKRLYRHRSPFHAFGKRDNMWSTLPDEGEPIYDEHDLHHFILDGY